MTEIAQRTPAQELAAQIRGKEFQEQVGNALPGNLMPERFVRAATTALNQNPDIANANRASVFTSLLRCAQDGLLPDGREAALVMFGKDAVYMPMIGGFRKIAAEHGWAIDTQVVYANDEFEYELGVHPRLIHRPPRLDQERGGMIGAYAVGTHSDGRKQVEVMPKSDILRVQAVSRARASGPWKDWPERMWEKTAGRRLFGKLPLGGRDEERIKRVLEASDAEYELGGSPEERAVSQQITAAVPAEHDDTPDDTPIEGEIVEPSDGGALFKAPDGPRGGAA